VPFAMIARLQCYCCEIEDNEEVNAKSIPLTLTQSAESTRSTANENICAPLGKRVVAFGRMETRRRGRLMMFISFETTTISIRC